jgi:hypothetical protein
MPRALELFDTVHLLTLFVTERNLNLPLSLAPYKGRSVGRHGRRIPLQRALSHLSEGRQTRIENLSRP